MKNEPQNNSKIIKNNNKRLSEEINFKIEELEKSKQTLSSENNLNQVLDSQNTISKPQKIKNSLKIQNQKLKNDFREDLKEEIISEIFNKLINLKKKTK